MVVFQVWDDGMMLTALCSVEVSQSVVSVWQLHCQLLVVVKCQFATDTLLQLLVSSVHREWLRYGGILVQNQRVFSLQVKRNVFGLGLEFSKSSS